MNPALGDIELLPEAAAPACVSFSVDAPSSSPSPLHRLLWAATVTMSQVSGKSVSSDATILEVN